MTINNTRFDDLIRSVLQDPSEPSQELTQRVRAMIAQRIVPTRRRNHNTVKKLLIAAVLAAMLSGIALAVYFLRPMDEIAETLENDQVADAFRSENAIVIDQSEQSGDYMITLMGIASAEDLDALNKGDVSKTYAVVAVSRIDGSPMPEIISDQYVPFYAIPLIKTTDVKPWQTGVRETQGGTVIDGVLYLLLGCGNLEVFADMGVYVAVTDRMFYSHDTYVYDEDTGAISSNEDYDGVNVLFELSLDVTKADSQKAEELLYGNRLEPQPTPAENNDPGDNDEGAPSIELDPWYKNQHELWEYALNIPLEECTLIEDSVKVCPVDAEGYISYEYEGEDFGVNNKTLFSLYSWQPVGEPIKHQISGYEQLRIEVAVLSPSGELTIMLYDVPAREQP